MAGYYDPSQFDSMRYRTGAPDPSLSYWEKPANVIGARNMIDNDPDYDWAGAGIDRQFVYDAYNRMGQANGGRSWWEWDALGRDDPYADTLRQAPEPAHQVQYSPTYKPDYLTQQATQPAAGQLPSGADLANLPGWQKTMAFIMGNGALQGAAMALPWMVLGGLSGAAVGGPIGGIVGAGGALAAGFLLGFAGDQENQEYARQRLLGKGYSPKFVDFLQNTFNAGFKTLNLPAEWLEQSVGTTAILGNAALPMLPYKIFGYEDMLDEYLSSSAETKRMLDNLPAVWDAARNTYEAAATTGVGGAISNLPAGIEWLADMATQGQTDVKFAGAGQVHVLGQAAPVQLDTVGAAILQAAANEIIAGQDPARVQEKYLAMTGFSGQFADLMYQSLADPLNIVPIAERGLVGKGAKLLGNPLLEQAAKQAVGEGLIGTYKQYGTMLRTGQEVAGVAAPAPWKMTRFQRWLADVTPEGVMKELQPGLEGALTRTKRSLFTFSENPLNPITWWSSLSELTPKSKFSMFTGLAQSNWGEILSTYDDVDAMMTDIQRFSSMQPAEAVVLGRQFNNAEMYTILQGQKGYAEKAKRYHDIWTSNEGRRQLLLRISGITGEDYHRTAARIKDGGPKEANAIYRELVNKVQEAQRVDKTGKTPEQIADLEAQARDAQALLADATFTPEVFKNVASQLKTNPWAFDPGYFKAFIYQDMTNHLEDWAIKSFGVKPENGIVRAGNALKAVQSLMLLDFSPSYAITNVLSNISTRAAEGSFGYLGPQRVKNYLDWIGHQEYRIEAGTAMAGDTRPAGKQRYASADEAYREGGSMAEAAWIAENSQQKAASAMRAEDWIQRAHDKVPKGFFMTKASSKAETVDSINTHYTWTTGTFARLWNRNGAIPKMPEGVRQSLASLDPRLPDLILAGVEAARTKGDISRLLTGITDLSRKADPYIEGVAQSLGIDSPMMREMLAKTNVLEKINERLADGATPEDAVNSVRRDVRAIVRAQQAERVKIAAAAGAARVRGEGLAGVAQSYRDAMWSHDEFWTRHFMEWERTYELAKGMSGPERSQLISERSAIQDQEWAAHNAEIEATWYGFLRDVGFTQGNLDAKARLFIGEMAGIHKSWKTFFQERQRKVRKFFKDSANVSPEYRDTLWDGVQQEMAALYDQYNQKELEATKRMGLAYLEMWKEQFGEGNLAGAAYWWKGVYDTTARRQALMADLRAWERGQEPQLPEVRQALGNIPPEQRHKAWPAFLERAYLPAIGEITQAHLDGINAVSDAATGRPGNPDWEAALEWFYPEQAQPAGDVEQAVAGVQAEIMAETAVDEFGANTRRVAEGGDEPEAPVEAEPLAQGGETQEPPLSQEQADQLGSGQPVPIEQAARTALGMIREPQTLAEVYPPALAQLGWTRDKKGTRNLLAAINKDRAEAGLEKYQSAAEVPWEEARAAIARRVQPPEPAEAQPTSESGGGKKGVTVQRYLDSRTIAGKPVIGAAYVDGKFAAYIPYRFDIGRVMDTAQGPARILGINADGAWVYRIENSGQVKVLQDGDETIPVAGPFTPGTMEANGATPMDEAGMWADGMANYVDPVLDELLTQMRGGQPPGGSGQGIDLSGLSASDRANFSRWIEQTAGAMSRAKMTSIRVGDTHRDLALLDYNKRYGFDNAAGLIFPYQFWFTRSMLNWSLRFADRPGMLAFFARLAQFKDENVDEQFKEIPSRLKGKVRIPVPFLNSVAPWAGGSVYVDPWGKLFPFREFLRPWERYLQDNTRIRRKAEQYLREWSDTGEVSAAEAQQAVDARGGALWDRAYAAAQENEGADAVDYLSLISSPNLALSMLVRGPEKTGPFPMSRLLQGLAATTGWDGLASLDPEAKLRKSAKLSEFGEWGDYYIDRMLANLAADGEISARDATVAMIERQGQAYDKALERTRLELAMREPTMLPVLAARNALSGDGNLLDVLGAALIGLIPGGLLPTGELKLRGLYDDYNQAWARKNSGEDPEAVNNFFKAHPEYEARLALYDDPEERMRQFLVGEIWDRWTQLPELYRNAAREELGQEFSVMFMNSETRDTDAISVDTLAGWAQQLGGYAPGGTAPDYAAPLRFQGNEAAQQYEQLKGQLFPGIGDLLSVYYNANDDQKAMLKQQYPQIQQYYNWRDIYASQNPELIQYFARSDPELAATDPETAYLVYMYRAEKARLFPEISMILDEYYGLPSNQRKQYKQSRMVGQYYDWEKQMLQQFPQIARFVKSDKSAFETLYGKGYSQEYGAPVNVYAWPVEVQSALQSRFTRSQRLSGGARSYLYYQWEKSGMQLGSFEKWLDSLGVYYGQ